MGLSEKSFSHQPIQRARELNTTDNFFKGFSHLRINIIIFSRVIFIISILVFRKVSGHLDKVNGIISQCKNGFWLHVSKLHLIRTGKLGRFMAFKINLFVSYIELIKNIFFWNMLDSYLGLNKTIFNLRHGIGPFWSPIP